MPLAGQVAIVTGGGGGLGRAMALGLAAEGSRILIAEVREPEGRNVVEEIRSSGGTAELFVGDISQEETARALIETCQEKLSGLDILINNAGLRMETHADDVFEDWRCLRQRPTHEVPIDEWDFLMGINLRAPYLCTHFALPHMIKKKRGVIINVSSDAGNSGTAGKSAYCASKHGLEGFTKALALEMQPLGISANAVYPGGRADVDGRGGADPDIMIPLILFLCNQKIPDVTGQSIMAKEWNEEHAKN